LHRNGTRAPEYVVSLIFKGNKMQPLLAHRDESAWERGEKAYDLGDTLEMGPIKAAQDGYRAGSNGYAAFITAFARMVRRRQVHPSKAGGLASGGSAVVLTGDFQRAG
jgi:hypothetical protein